MSYHPSAPSPHRYPNRLSLPNSQARNVPVILSALRDVVRGVIRGDESGAQRAKGRGTRQVNVVEIAAGEGLLSLRMVEYVRELIAEGDEEVRVKWCCTEGCPVLVDGIRRTVGAAQPQTRGKGSSSAASACTLEVLQVDIGASEDWARLREAMVDQSTAQAQAQAQVQAKAQLVIIANLLHIVPWPLVEVLWSELGSLVAPGGRVCVYGAFNEGGEFTSEGNRRVSHPSRAGIYEGEEL